jgi:hypothetical protein
MKLRSSWTPTMRVLIRSLGAIGICSVFLGGIVSADDMPIFRQGLWEFNRTVENIGNPGKPQTMKVQKCTSPTEDMKKQNAMITKSVCSFSPTVKNGKTYRFTMECKIQGVTAQSTSVMTVENDSAYSVKVESRSGGKGTNETLQARRTGDCTK